MFGLCYFKMKMKIKTIEDPASLKIAENVN